MNTLKSNKRQQLLIYLIMAVILCMTHIVFAIEPIATIGRPHPEKHAFIDNDTILRVVPTHIQIVNANTGELIDTFGNFDFSYRSDVVVSQNVSHIAVQNNSNIPKRDIVKIWDVKAREQIVEWEIEGYIDVAAISPTQPLLATSIRNEIHLWNLQTGILIGKMEGDRRPADTCYYVDGRRRTCLGPIQDFASVFTPDGRYLIVASMRPDIELWNVETRELEGHFEGHTGNWVNGVFISPDGAYLASYDKEQPTVYLWNMKTRELMWKTQTDNRRISDLKFSPDSQHLYVARSSAVERWHVKSGELIDMFGTEFKSFLQTITVSPDGIKVLLFYMDGEILWDIEKKQILKKWTDFITYWYQNEIELSPDGKTVLAMSPRSIKTWDVASQQMRLFVSTPGNIYNTIAISHDSQKFAVGREPIVEIRDMQTGEIETQFPHHIILPEKIAFSSSGKWLAVMDHWGRIDILNTVLPEEKQRLQPPFTLGMPNGVYQVGFSENEDYFVTSGHTRVDNNNTKIWIQLWKRAEDTFIYKYAWLGGFAAQPILKTDADGSTLLVGNGRDGVHVWKLLPDEPILLSSFDAEYPLQFSEDGRYLLAYSDEKFQIWDWRRSTLINQSSFPRFVSMSEDGSLLLTHDIHGQYLIWDLTPILSFLSSVEPKGKQLVTLGQIKRNQLLQNFPNPFNPETWIPFRLADESPVTIEIFSATGELVRAISSGTMKTGDYSSQMDAVHWNGNNDEGEPVSSGVYFYTINAGDFSATRKMHIRK